MVNGAVVFAAQGIVASTEPCGKFAGMNREPFSVKAPAGECRVHTVGVLSLAIVKCHG